MFSKRHLRTQLFCEFCLIVFLVGPFAFGDDWGGEGTYSNPYYLKIDPTATSDGLWYRQGQDYTIEYGRFILKQHNIRKLFYLDALGNVREKKVTGTELQFSYEGEWDDNCNYSGEIVVHDRLFKNEWIPNFDLVAKDTIKTCLWTSSCGNNPEHGTQNAEARVKEVGMAGFADIIEYQFEFRPYDFPDEFNPWTLEVTRTCTPGFTDFSGGYSDSFHMDEIHPNTPAFDVGTLYGTLIDWIFYINEDKRDDLTSCTLPSLYNPNLEFPQPWSDSEMRWMWPSL